MRRSINDRWFGGVIGGIAEAADLNADTLRLIFVICSIFIHMLPLIYLIAWMVIPEW